MRDLIGSQERDFMRGDAEIDLGKSRVILGYWLNDCSSNSNVEGGSRARFGRKYDELCFSHVEFKAAEGHPG
ncbi:hypothetical protein FKM82_014010 [Ascaphus truei]